MSDSEQTEGEQLTALGSFEPFPFRHGSRRDTFPARGDSFWVALPPVGAAIGRPYSLMHKHGGRPMAAPTTFPINFCVISQKNSPLLAEGRGAF